MSSAGSGDSGEAAGGQSNPAAAIPLSSKTNPSLDRANSAPAAHGHAKEGFWALAIGSIGVVFGDIGTSPLYAM